ncbi:MAG: energy transducer TonB [Rhodocyclales bacterium]|nr:energy transducer TonB [Rhodocyclales bacterium]
MTKRLGCYLLLSAALHLLLLWLPGFAPGGASRLGAGSGRIEVRLRLLESSPATVHNPVAEQPPTMESLVVAQERHQEIRAPDPGVPVDAAARDDSAAVSPLPVLPASLPRGFDRDAYFSGDVLDVRPTPEHPIIIGLDDPQGMNKDKGQVVLVMYVGASGAVDHVDIDSADVPSEIAEALAEVFRNAKMRPGIKDDRPVKSRMKVLVEFEVR